MFSQEIRAFVVKETAASPDAPASSAADGYWLESRRPLSSLALITPLMVIYEGGVLLLGVQNGADAWMRGLLNLLGFSQHFLLPVLTVCILLAWHYLTRQPWRISGGTLSGMAVECLLLAVALWLILQMQGVLFQTLASTALGIGAKAKDAVGYLGAGIYEELLFRLILLSLVIWVLRSISGAPRAGMAAGVVVCAVLFAAAHHVGAYGEPFVWFQFVFRVVAGVFFSIVFVYRGFGIAAGTHAVYDILIDFLHR